MEMDSGRLVVRCLGPLELSVGGRAVEVTAGRLRTLVVVLALSAGRPVSLDTLGDAVWGNGLPADVRASLQTYKSRLRGLFGRASIDVLPTGYALLVDSDDVDVLRFDRFLDAAGRVSDPREERALLAEALPLWRGTPFEDVRSEWLEKSETPRLTERYLRAMERYVDLDIAAGASPDLEPLLRLASQHPLRESLWERLLVALDRRGRTAEALEWYETIRTRIGDELGVGPGARLKEVHARLLGRTTRVASVPPVVPRQLPPDIAGFVGREAALATLDELIGDDRLAQAATITGTAGIGKTALAVHWAHQVADRFPDGQLYVNLRGFDPSGQAMAPAEALRGFLDGLRVAPQHIPAGFDAQRELYGDLLADKRVLVVLDNARDTDQVRQLLPHAPGCRAVVTSRSQPAGERSVDLDLLTRTEARQLLTRRLGQHRIDAEPEAVEQIVDMCSRLPLALAVVAARSATGLASVVAELGADDTLDALSGDDLLTDVRAVFSWSYRTLSADAARMFRLLGVHPGPDISAPAAASLAGVPVPRANALLAELLGAHLVVEHAPGRYSCHDLLRAYAIEVAHLRDVPADRHEAVHRVLDHYLHSAHGAGQLISAPRDGISMDPVRSGVVPETVGDYQEAIDWFAAEHPVLLAAVQLAAGAGFDSHVWRFAWSLALFFDRRAYWRDWVAVQHAAVDAARRLSDRPVEARAERMLGHAYLRLRRYHDAETHCLAALDICRETGDRVGQAWSHRMCGYMYGQQDRWPAALEHERQALAVFRLAGHETGHAGALTGVGVALTKLGDYRQAIEYCREALERFELLADRHSQADAWEAMGDAHLPLGEVREATTCYQRALAIYGDAGDRYLQAGTLVRLGDIHQATGNTPDARGAWSEALAMYEQLEHPHAQRVRRKLS